MAGGDITLTASELVAGGDAELDAGGDITIDTLLAEIEISHSHKSGMQYANIKTNHGTEITAGGDFTAIAAGDIAALNAIVTAAGNAKLDAAGDVIIAS